MEIQKVSETRHTRVTVKFETQKHSFSVGEATLEEWKNEKNGHVKAYQKICASLKADGVDSPLEIQDSRDEIFKHIFPETEIPYVIEENQMVLADYLKEQEAKDDPVTKLVKEKEKIKQTRSKGKNHRTITTEVEATA